MIALEGITKKYGDTVAVNRVTLGVEEKENLILLGTSGCGKTTTLKMINRLIQPDEGEIFINGENVTTQNVECLRQGIGYVMQHIGLFPHYTIEENIAVVPKLLKWDKKKTAERIRELIIKLHLSEASLTLFPSELSGGQQQRVGLARALVADPKILLMDEPFGALDNVTRTSIQQEFKDLDELKRKTIVMVTHDVQEAFELADRICLMDKGSIMQIGTPKDLLFSPANDFTRKFFDGQRLALEFKVLKISDIWKQLNDGLNSSDEIYSDNDSIWAAMERLRAGEINSCTFSNANGTLKTVNFEQLTTAFNQHKNTLIHG